MPSSKLLFYLSLINKHDQNLTRLIIKHCLRKIFPFAVFPRTRVKKKKKKEIRQENSLSFVRPRNEKQCHRFHAVFGLTEFRDDIQRRSNRIIIIFVKTELLIIIPSKPREGSSLLPKFPSITKDLTDFKSGQNEIRYVPCSFLISRNSHPTNSLG